MKKKGLALIIVVNCILFSGCMPTPEHNVVVNKNDGELTKAIENTDMHEKSLVFQTEQIDTYQTRFETKDNEVHFVVDAQVDLPDTNRLPVAYIRPMNISQSFADKAMDTLIGDHVIYADIGEKTKGQIEKEIVAIQYQMENVYPEYEQEECAYLMSRDQAYLKELYILLETARNVPSETALRKFHAPDAAEFEGETEPLVDSGLISEDQAGEMAEQAFLDERVIKGIADLGKNNYASIEIFKYSAVNQGVWFKNGEVDENFVYDKDVAGIDEAQALDIAEETMAEMDIAGFVFCRKGYAATYDNGRDNQEYAFNFLFKRAINNVMTAYVGQSKYHPDMKVYSEPWRDELIQIAVDQSGVVYFNYRCPIVVDEIANENVTVLPFEDITKIFEDQMKIGYAYNQRPPSCCANDCN